MKEIKKLSNEIMEEVEGAKQYAKCYNKYKEERPVWAKQYLEMANDELRHANYLHGMVVELIDAEKAKGTEIPEYMMEMWEEKHDDYIEEVSKVKVILSM